MAGYSYQQAGIVTPTGATQVTGVAVAGDFWQITGAKLALGRAFAPDEEGQVAITWELFQHEFAGASGVIGSPLMVDGRAFHVAAVLDRDFRFQFPVWWAPARQQPVEILFSFPRKAILTRLGAVVAALKPGVQAGQALAELETLEGNIVRARPAPGQAQRLPMTRLHVDPLQEKLVGQARPAVLALLAASGFVLLICCVNIASLLVARATARQTEFAIRTALGAGRFRLVRQSLAENAAVALPGGLAGLAVARVAIGVMMRQWPDAVPRLAETAIDIWVAGFVLAASAGACIVMGCGPAMLLWRTDPQGALKEGGRTSAGTTGLRARRLLVSLEVALALVLLSGAGLMLKSFWRMHAYPPGFAPESTLLMKLRLAFPQYSTNIKQQAYMSEVLRRAQSIPGVKAAGISSWSLLSGAPAFLRDRSPQTTHIIRFSASSPGYLRAMGMRLVKGRWLTEADSGVALLNESMAREMFGDANPIGQTIYKIRSPMVVGVVADLKYSKLDAEAPAEVFIPYREAPMLLGADLAVRIAGDPMLIAPDLRKLISAIDPSQPAYDLKTLDQTLANSIAPRRFNLFLLGTFASAALLLALVGIYGVLAFSVARRTREIGIRTALGAQRGQVIRMVVGEGMALVFAGMAAGLIAAGGLTRLMATMLYDVKPTTSRPSLRLRRR
jgi:putative ABC transport system permease protein